MRAGRQAMIIGNFLAVDVAMQRNTPKRKSMLNQKTKLCLEGIAIRSFFKYTHPAVKRSYDPSG